MKARPPLRLFHTTRISEVMLYREKAPADPLKHLIECLWSIEVQGETSNYVSPDGCVDIVYSPSFGCRIVGAMTREQVFVLAASTRTLGIRFRPGMARSILGISIAELTDSFLSVEDLWPKAGRELRNRLDNASFASSAFEILEESVSQKPRHPTALEQAFRELTAGRGTLSLNYLARQANLSDRQFRRTCREESGLRPKQLSRILRFRHGKELAFRAAQPDWAAIAIEAGYCDQSHLIRDFVLFTGRNPSVAVLSNTYARGPTRLTENHEDNSCSYR